MQLGISMGETLYFLWGYDVLNPGMVATIECLARSSPRKISFEEGHPIEISLKK
jgi:hypothetical protein